MTTRQYISWLSQRIGGNLFSRQQLVDAVNQAQNEILGRDLWFMRVKPDPYFVTVAGTQSYVANDAILDSIDETTTYNIRNVSRIYTFNVRSSPMFAYGGLNLSTHRPESLVNAMNSDEAYIPADCEQSIDPTADDCLVKIWRENDPGTHADIYMAECYKWPTQITSESVALSMPDQFQRGLLKLGVLRDLEYTEFGSADRPELMYEKELARFDSWASRGAKTILTCTPPREC